ncbi:putative beta-carotene-binding protein [Phymastichus coffea]|uniref:putative beta-carotene-binding protein n=1 Tax=Phymastichus coffea TaxID=108790 RepID=UPI00273C1BF7|nr:putative beta-carotene-binding protein [Phymastichus coffea]
MAHTHICLLAVAALVATLAHAEVPPYIKTCGRRNPRISECVKESVSYLIPTMRAGVPELDVPALEPLYVEEIALADLADFKAIAYNVKLRGLSNYVIKYLKVDLDKATIDLDILFPKVFMTSDYDVKAKILVPINEKGPIDITTDNVESKVTLRFKKVERRGRTLIYFPTMSCKLVVKDYTANFMPGANDNPIVKAINSVLVSSSKEIIESMTPNLEKAVSSKVLDVANRICKHFTYDELFPDRV